jgi:hypothetical protein
MNNMRRNSRGEFGCSLSHIKAITHALNDGAERPLFLEDDVEFIREPDLSGLPDDYDVCYLGGHPREPVKRISENLVRVGAFSFAEAYSLNRKAILPFLDYWFDNIGQPQAQFDFILGRFAKERNGYCVVPVVTRQRKSVSMISGTIDEKDVLVERGWRTNLT